MESVDRQESGRTGKALKNTKVVAVCQLVYMFMGFICKTVFTNILGKEYAGVNGVIGNILSVLSFVELGMGSAIVYRLYDPIRKQNYHKICQYMKLYKKIYTGIALLIFVFGILIMPFLQYIVNASSVKESLYLIYFLFLLNTCISYTFMHKKQILVADQKTYITSIVQIGTMVAANVINILFLILFHNYIVYLVIQVLFTFLDNMICTVIVTRQYPYLSGINKHGNLPAQEVRDFIADVKGLFLQKCAATVFGSTDNIFISRFLGVAVVGIVAQYLLPLGMFTAIMTGIFGSVTASVGDLCVTGARADYKYSVFRKIYFVNALLSGYICLGMLLLEKIFVTELWYDSSFALGEEIVFLIVTEWYLRQLHYPVYLFRSAGGYFSKLKWVPVIAAVINILLDFILVSKIGLSGIFIATIIARFVVRQADTIVTCRYVFGSKVFKYWKIHFKYLAITGVLFLLLRQIMVYTRFEGAALFLYGIGLVTVCCILVDLLLFHGSDEMQYFKELLRNQIKLLRNGRSKQ